jgi:hypothetical protein
MTPKDVKKIIAETPKGKRTNLSWADLRGADLRGADLSWANLSEANLSAANLSEANLSEADFSWANLSEANFSAANLSEADLSWANLRKANLSAADLSETNLRGAALPQRFMALPSVGKSVRGCWAWVSNEGVDITLGCRKFSSWDAARRHYNAVDYSGECAGRVDMAIAALDYGERAEALVRRSLANG